MNYQVALDAFHGPMDLLLYLVRKQELSVRTIPIARITAQFLDYLDVLTQIDIDYAGEFVVLAATLMEIKSRMLLPGEPASKEAEAADPRRELVKQLLEYRRYRDASRTLEEFAARQSLRFSRESIPEAEGDTPTEIRRVEVWDLVSAFARLMRETHAGDSREIVVDETPQYILEARILERLSGTTSLAFRDLFEPPYSRTRMIGVFLAVLELMKAGRIALDQPETCGEILLSLRRDAPEAGGSVAEAA